MRTLERLRREEARRARQSPEHLYPWEAVENSRGAFRLYAWSEVERLLYGALAYRPTCPRPANEEAVIERVVDRLTAADDPPRSFREWLAQLPSDASG